MHRLLIVVALLWPPLLLSALPITFGVRDDAPARAAEAGVRRIVIRADWPRLQPDARRWSFAWLDTAVDDAVARGLQVVLQLGPAAPWAIGYLKNPTPTEAARAHPDLPAYTAYVTAVARRYADRVTHYQLWERPTGTRLLAAPNTVRAIFRAGARALHAVNPSLQAVVSEPGDLDLGWIDEYLDAARGDERADVLLLSPAHFLTTPDALWWRMTVLRSQVLAADAPLLWADVPAPDWRMAAAALLQGVDGVIVSGADLSDHPTRVALHALEALQGWEYAGWALLGPHPGGVFTQGAARRVLLLPLQAGSLTLLSSATPQRRGVAVPGGAVTVAALDDVPRRLRVDDETVLPLTTNPLLLEGVAVPLLTGMPVVQPPAVRGNTVGFDPTGEDPCAIHALRHLPGGHFSITTIERQPVLCTVQKTAPWLHFTVPDGFLYYNQARRPVQVTLKIYGAQTARKCGFNLYYDSVGGMMNSPWQWIDVGPNTIFTYTVRLDDALFADREGYDLRVSMGGSDEPVRLVGISVTKL
jgi:hypothetical protein